jgi:hypothetical protein
MERYMYVCMYVCMYIFFIILFHLGLWGHQAF